ncbi:parathyroid hormone 4 [Megalops cyprinoides]|uniref:parathyroid hormone 4 n=1 Tax=Megalops cyprinoides TaxID=118141 RepID=UPI0018646405|nr:parathyroid hormone 4 [Megalops cyprinoides]
MMLVSQKSIQSVAVIVIVVFAFTQCQENERRAVTEHQLLHDRGRAMQSLKRLIWLSSAMEGLHTAHTRAPGLDYDPADCRADATKQELLSHLGRGGSVPKGGLLQMLWSAVHKPHLTALPDGEK